MVFIFVGVLLFSLKGLGMLLFLPEVGELKVATSLEAFMVGVESSCLFSNLLARELMDFGEEKFPDLLTLTGVMFSVVGKVPLCLLIRSLTGLELLPLIGEEVDGESNLEVRGSANFGVLVAGELTGEGDGDGDGFFGVSDKDINLSNILFF